MSFRPVILFWSQRDKWLLQVVLDVDRLAEFALTPGHRCHRKGKRLLDPSSRVPLCPLGSRSVGALITVHENIALEKEGIAHAEGRVL